LEATRVETKIGDKVFAIETGKLAKQAAGSCTIQLGETVVLCATTTGTPREGIDFFPLTCDYRERLAGAGKFPGGFLKREGRPTQKETLTARLVDRPIRPFFPKGFRDEVQVQTIVMASDQQNDGDVLAMTGASAALCLSPMPFLGPLAAVRMGYVDGKFVPFPTQDELEESDLDLVISGTIEAVAMIEGFAREMPEDLMAEAITESHKVIKGLCELQSDLCKTIGVEKAEYEAAADDGLLQNLRGDYYEAFKTAKQTEGKMARADAVAELKAAAKAAVIPDPDAEGAVSGPAFSDAWHDLESVVVRDLILSGKRADGRDSKSLREITCEVDVLPCVHGSAIFQRGETQAFITIALGTQRDEQRVDGVMEEYSKKFMLDYNFPSFSVGEARPNRGPGRREIGHGALAERSVKPVLPGPEDFPYTVRVVSDILESNGSSSMASVCGATLGLMAAGVPITNPVAGISIGLVSEGDDYTLLTDIIGDEDHFGDMDFKVAGTQNGITGIQLDLKIEGISDEIVRGALAQAREARIEILRNMLTTIPRPKEETASTAPRLLRTSIHPDKIGMLIGPGGKNIRSLQETTGTVIEVDDDGVVTIAASDGDAANAALQQVEMLTASVQVGKIYKGRVSSVKDFGAFIEILPGRDGLCHISELSNEYVNSVADICQVGEEIEVKVIAVDEQDRVKLSRRAVLAESENDDDGGDEDSDD
jgi:polyribonucleotide nucleotidyltransferase